MITQVKRESLAEQAAELLLARVRAGEWRVGDRLPGETTLAGQLGVGRSTLREAIRDLAGRGVLVSRQGAGVFVAAADVPDAWDDVLRRADISAVLEARAAIESEAAALAAARRSAADLGAMHSTLDHRRTVSGSGDIEAYVAADVGFHRTVVVAARNPVLLELFDALTPRIQAAMVDMLRLRGGISGRGAGVPSGDGTAEPTHDDDHRAHLAIIDAVADRDAAAAAHASRIHLDGLAGALS
ncbi:FadR/GntR family transcriptional regulator [Gordonia shandongensis]|uniref:FadR/GntR family transcriptional regulator n=1 Tax=Gordonia shandongensis TaxID=376351 RepID=UPI0003FCAECA|nr:FCD domain-containing protein [Gordonia shandongensis]